MGWPVAKSSLRCHCCKIYYARNPNRGEAGRRRTLGLSLFTADEGAGKLVGLTSCRGGDVKSLVTATLLLLFGLNVVAQDSSKPKISPFFDRIDDGPAFFVECRNTTGETVSSAHVMWASSLRIDGKLLPNEVHAGSGRFQNELPGLRTDIPRGEVWRGIIGLRRSQRPFLPAPKFGALLRAVRTASLSQGKHSIAVQCGREWSEEFSFYWETETVSPF
jgi:hypothetical protein